MKLTTNEIKMILVALDELRSDPQIRKSAETDAQLAIDMAHADSAKKKLQALQEGQQLLADGGNAVDMVMCSSAFISRVMGMVKRLDDQLTRARDDFENLSNKIAIMQDESNDNRRRLSSESDLRDLYDQAKRITLDVS